MIESSEKMSRLQARAVECPVCGAESEQRCTGARGRPRESNHLERVAAARAALAEDPDLTFGVADPWLDFQDQDAALELALTAAGRVRWPDVPCPRGSCGAGPEQGCRDRSGRARPVPHAGRVRRAAALRAAR